MCTDRMMGGVAAVWEISSDSSRARVSKVVTKVMNPNRSIEEAGDGGRLLSICLLEHRLYATAITWSKPNHPSAQPPNPNNPQPSPPLLQTQFKQANQPFS